MKQHGADEGHRAVHGVIGDDGPVQRGALPRLGRDGAEPAAYVVHRTVDGGLRGPPGDAGLPHQQQGEQRAVFGQCVEGGGDAGAPLPRRYMAPGAVPFGRGGHGLAGRGGARGGQPGEGGAVERTPHLRDRGRQERRLAAVVPVVPVAATQAAQAAVGGEGLGGGVAAAAPGLGPRGAGLEGQGGRNGWRRGWE
nr:hypothetical protein [Streptomyces sp. Amel2xB2]